MTRRTLLLVVGVLAIAFAMPGATSADTDPTCPGFDWACKQCDYLQPPLNPAPKTQCKTCMNTIATPQLIGRAWVCLACSKKSDGTPVSDANYIQSCTSSCATKTDSEIPGWWCQRLTDKCQDLVGSVDDGTGCLGCFKKGGSNFIDACTSCMGLASENRQGCFDCIKLAVDKGVASSVAYKCDDCAGSALCRKCLREYPNKQDLCVSCRDDADFNTCAGTPGLTL